MDLKNEILRLAEMQYRKGFEAGYLAASKGVYTVEQVKDWSYKGWKQGFNKSQKVNSKNVYSSLPMLVSDLRNAGINRIASALENTNANKIEVTDIADSVDGGLQISVNGITNFSDNEIIKKIKEVFSYE